MADALRPLPFLLAIFAVFYAVDLTAFQLSIDDEGAVYRKTPDIWVVQGRWVVYLFERFVLTRPVVPFLPHALFGFFISLAYLVVLRTHGVRRLTFVHYALFPMFAAFPTWFFLLAFLALTPSAGLGVLAASGAIATFAKYLVGSRAKFQRQPLTGGLGWLVVSGGLGAISLGTYQSNLLLLVVLGLGVVLSDALRREVSLGQLVRSVCALGLLAVVTFGIYMLVNRIFLLCLGAEPSYVGPYFQPDQLLADPIHVVSRTLHEGLLIYGGDPLVHGAHAFGFGLIILLGLAAVVAAPSLAGRRGARATFFLFAAAILAVPLGLNLVAGGFMPHRSLVAIPATVWLFGYLGLTVGGRWIARATLLVVLIAACQSLYVSSLFQAAGAHVQEHDRALAIAIHERIEAVHPNFSRSEVHKVEFYGAMPFSTVYPQIPGDTRGKSFFEWGGGRPDRIIWYMRLIGFDHLRGINHRKRTKLIPTLEEMPIWPEQGCVRVVDDVTLVRLGREPGLVHRRPAGSS